MPQQYSASDPRTGLEVQVTGEFPPDPDDRVRIARTTNLFARLMSTILATEDEAERRQRFKAVETQLEVADALVRGDLEQVQHLVKETLESLGVTEEQLQDMERQIREQLETLGERGASDRLFPWKNPPEPPAEDDDDPERPAS